MTKLATDWKKKIFAKYTYENGQFCKIHKNTQAQQEQNEQYFSKIGGRPKQTIQRGKYTDGKYKYAKMLIINYYKIAI